MGLLSIALYLHRPDLFGNPLVDVFRSVCVILSVLLMSFTVRAVLEQRRRGFRLLPGELDRLLSMGLSALSIAYTEIVVQGTDLTVRLPVNLLAIVLGLRGLYRLRQAQKRR